MLTQFSQSEWRETGKKKKKQKGEPTAPSENHVESKPDKREAKDHIDRDNRDRSKEDESTYREQSDNYRRPRRNDNRPPRLSRGRGRPDRAGDRPDREEEGDREENRDRPFTERGRGRGRGGFAPRRGGRGGRFEGYVNMLFQVTPTILYNIKIHVGIFIYN